jgi:predicted transposase/invertase (TIGR01784 family)
MDDDGDKKDKEKRPGAHHDSYFKDMMSFAAVYIPFLSENLPDYILAEVDITRAEPTKDHFVEKEARQLYSDCLFKMPYKEKDEILVYVLVEHQSKSDRWMPLRMWRYIFAIWEQYRRDNKPEKLPLIVPILLHSGKSPYTHPLAIKDLIQAPTEWTESLLTNEMLLIDLPEIEDEELVKHAELGVMLITLKHARDDLLDHDRLLLQLERITDDRESMLYTRITLNYLFQVRDKEEALEFTDKAVQVLSKEKGAEMTSIAEMWMEQGIEKGIEESKRKFAVRLLEKGYDDALILDLVEISPEQLAVIKHEQGS